MEKYPRFRPLDKEDKQLFDEAFRKDPPLISEFTFTNLFAWREIYSFEVAELEGLIIIRSSADKNQAFFEPVGGVGKKEAIERIIIDTKAIFTRVSESCSRLIDRDRFEVVSDRDHADYLYKASDLALLTGRKYDGKRNLIKKFKSGNTFEFVRLREECSAACFEFAERWCSLKDCDDIEGLRKERQAVDEMISLVQEFNLIAGGIKINQAIYGLAIAERLNPDTLVMHVLKAHPGITGLYQTLLNEFILHLEGQFTYVNLEQDLGLRV